MHEFNFKCLVKYVNSKKKGGSQLSAYLSTRTLHERETLSAGDKVRWLNSVGGDELLCPTSLFLSPVSDPNGSLPAVGPLTLDSTRSHGTNATFLLFFFFVLFQGFLILRGYVFFSCHDVIHIPGLLCQIQMYL